MQLKVTDNADGKRFEAQVDDRLILLEYIKTKELFFLTHTEVPPALEGQGYGFAMVEAVLPMVEDSGLKLAPLCPFVVAYIKRHPEWKRIVSEKYNLG
ncbi:GNAT family N-acetyltransferase [Croceiramulus getboli]|nr:GNAT family N-acetyltransferase [Flavobacteriaceae bacterium YJPT1-3]